MLELNGSEIVGVDGKGALTLAAVALFIYHEREHIGDFFEGMFEGYDQNKEAHK